MTRLLSYAIIIVFILSALSYPSLVTSNSSSSMPKQAGSAKIYLPLVVNTLSPIILNTTNVLTSATTQYLTDVTNNDSTFTFNQMTPELANVSPGEVITGAPSTHAPYGFLRKVTAISSIAGTVIVQTDAATLEDAIDQGAIQISRELLPQNVQQQNIAPGVIIQDLGTFSVSLNQVLYDNDGSPQTTNDQVRANGSITLKPSFDFGMTIRKRHIEQLHFIDTTTETANLAIEAGAEASIKKEIELARFSFSPIIVFIGFMPLVFVPTLSVYVGIDGNVHVGISTGITQEAQLQIGVRYVINQWQPVREFTNNVQNNLATLTPSIGLDTKEYTSARLGLLLYGVLGPHVDLDIYLRLHADPLAVPWWALYGGLEVPLSFDLQIFSRAIIGYQTTLIQIEKLLASATNEVSDISGEWNGVLTQPGTTFRFALTLTQTGHNIQGTSTIRNGAYYAVMSLNGTVTGTTGNLNEIAIIETNGVPSGISRWCIKTLNLGYTNTNSAATLNGDWHQDGCNAGQVQLQKSTNPITSVQGSWNGTLTQPGTTFPFELSLNQTGSDIQGTSTIRSGNTYANMSLDGFIAGNIVYLTESGVIDTNGGNWCIKTMQLTYTSPNGVMHLDGDWSASGCNSGQVSLQKQ